MTDKLINMTIEDAIQEIDALVHAAMGEYNIKDEEDDYDEEVLGVAVWAMKKQIPMKPLSSYGEYTCPMCEITVSKGDEHCWHCGQKLDWED